MADERRTQGYQDPETNQEDVAQRNDTTWSDEEKQRLINDDDE